MRKLLLLLFISVCFHPLHAQDLTARLDSLSKEYEKNHFNAVIVIAKGDKVIYEKAIGYANMDLKTPMTTDKLFKTESVGKMFTATRIMQLVKMKKIDLSKTVSHYLPDWKIKNADKITIHQLLNHTSGLTSVWDAPNYDFKKLHSDAEIKVMIENQPLAFDQPGLRFSYSNSGYHLLGVIIEKFDNTTLENAFRKYIFEPAGMKNIGHLNDTVMPKTAAQPYIFYSSKDYAGYAVGIGPKAGAAGGWVTTAKELLKFPQAYLSGKYLDTNTMRMQYTANGTVDINKKGYQYAYGLEILTDQTTSGKTIIGHHGGGGGFSVDAFFEKESGYSIVMCSNMFGIGRAISGNYFNLLLNRPVKKVQQNNVILSVDHVQAKGVEYLLANTDTFFHDLGFKPTMRTLLFAAENLSSLKDFRSAEAFLTIAQKMYPDEGEVWLETGSLAFKQNNKPEAKEAYLKAEKLAIEQKNNLLLNEIRRRMTELEK